MSARDELAKALMHANQTTVSAEAMYEQEAEEYAEALLAAGYRKAEPVWEPSLLNDGIYEYTQTASCDGSVLYNYRRPPRHQHEGGYASWESYEPAVTS